MNKTSTITSIILGASIGAALLKFYSLPKEEKDALVDYLKKTTNDLLDDAESTVEKVEQYMGEVKSKGDRAWVEKIYIFKKMFRELYGFDKKFLL